MEKPRIDNDALYAALNATREHRNLSWRDLATQIGTSPSTFTRLAQGKGTDADTFARIMTWLGTDWQQFVRGGSEAARPETVAVISSYLRADRSLTPQAAAALERIINAAYNTLSGPTRAGGGRARPRRANARS